MTSAKMIPDQINIEYRNLMQQNTSNWISILLLLIREYLDFKLNFNFCLPYILC